MLPPIHDPTVMGSIGRLFEALSERLHGRTASQAVVQAAPLVENLSRQGLAKAHEALTSTGLLDGMAACHDGVMRLCDAHGITVLQSDFGPDHLGTLMYPTRWIVLNQHYLESLSEAEREVYEALVVACLFAAWMIVPAFDEVLLLPVNFTDGPMASRWRVFWWMAYEMLTPVSLHLLDPDLGQEDERRRNAIAHVRWPVLPESHLAQVINEGRRLAQLAWQTPLSRLSLSARRRLLREDSSIETLFAGNWATIANEQIKRLIMTQRLRDLDAIAEQPTLKMLVTDLTHQIEVMRANPTRRLNAM